MDRIINYFESISNNFKNEIKSNYTKCVILSTTIMCLIAHAYKYFNTIYAHDMMFVTEQRNYVSGLIATKWLLSHLHDLIGFSNVTWLSGVLTIIAMSIAVYCLCKSLDIKSKIGIVLVAGVFVINPAIIMGHLFTPSDFAFAAAFAMLGVWMLQRNSGNSYLNYFIGVFSIACTAATYGSYAFSALTLMLLILIFDIIKGEVFKKVFKKSMKFASAYVVGMVIWYAILKIALKVRSVSLQAYMGESNLESLDNLKNIPNLIVQAYKKVLYYFLYDNSFGNVHILINRCLIVLAVVLTLLVIYVERKKIKDFIINILFLVILIGIIPLAMNGTYVVTGGNVHSLMMFPTVMMYVYLIKLCDIFKKKEYKRIILCLFNFLTQISLIVYIYGGILLANQAYLHLQNNYEISLSIGTRILANIESCEDYSGKETVVLIGAIGNTDYFNKKDFIGFENLNSVGIASRNITHVFSYSSLFPLFLTNVLGSNMNFYMYDNTKAVITSLELSDYEKNEVLTMGNYPADGSIIKCNDYIFVKLSD